MPKDVWGKSNARAKYGPVCKTRKRTRTKSSKKKRIPSNFKNKKDFLYVVYAGTPIRVIKPNNTIVEMKATKNLRFGSESKEFQEDGHRTFKRFGHYLIVKQELTGRQTAVP